MLPCMFEEEKGVERKLNLHILFMCGQFYVIYSNIYEHIERVAARDRARRWVGDNQREAHLIDIG